MTAAEVAGEYLVDLAERLTIGCDPGSIRAVVERVRGGQLDALGADGRRASVLTSSGIPFEASVSGGRGQITPVIRYVTATATPEADFGSRVSAQLAAIRDLVAWLPNGVQTVADMFQCFVTTLYPDTSELPRWRHRSPTWIGAVHHAAAPRHVARLKVYGGPPTGPGGLYRVCSALPGFAGLASVPDHEKLIKPVGAAIEVDAHGEVNHKIYLKARYNDVAVPMKLVRYFGAPAWEALSELARCGVDAAELHRHDFFVCCARGQGAPVFALHLVARRRDDLTGLARELASRHHGTTHGVDALALAAESVGASWRYSAVGLGFSADHGIDRLNVYGIPTWSAA